MPKPDEKAPAKLADAPPPKDEKKPDGEMADGEGGLDVAAVVKAIKDGSITVKDFAAITEAMSAMQPSAEPEGGADMEDQVGKAATPVQLRTDPKVAARLAAAEDKIEQFERRDRMKARVEMAHAKFEAEGVHLSESREKTIARFAEVYSDDTDFEGALTEFVSGLEPDPAPSFGAAASRARTADAPEIAQFAAQGPDVLAKARKLHAIYRDNASKGLVGTVTVEEFIKSGINSPLIG